MKRSKIECCEYCVYRCHEQIEFVIRNINFNKIHPADKGTSELIPMFISGVAGKFSDIFVCN
jgi:hypothetical protein